MVEFIKGFVKKLLYGSEPPPPHVDHVRMKSFQWPPQWVYVPPDVALALCKELRRELPCVHPLAAVGVEAIAKRRDNDDVLFALSDVSRPYAVVHLTWTGRQEETAEFPWTTFYGSFEQWRNSQEKVDIGAFRETLFSLVHSTAWAVPQPSSATQRPIWTIWQSFCPCGSMVITTTP